MVIMRSFDLITAGFKHVENVEKINQTKIVVADTEKILAVLLSEIKNSDLLLAFIGAYPPVIDKDGRFLVALESKPFHTGININTIIEDKNESNNSDEAPKIQVLKEKYEELFVYIFNTYHIKDGELFLNILLDTLDSDYIERTINSEIAIKDINFINGVIPNRKIFDRIVAEYQELSEDNEIQNVPWTDFFIFTHINSETLIDCNFMSRNLAEVIKLEIEDIIDLNGDNLHQNNNGSKNKKSLKNLDNDDDINSNNFNNSDENDNSLAITCESIKDNKNNDIKNKFNIRAFENNQSQTYYLLGTVSYNANIIEESFNFIYDLKSKRIIDLELVQ